jgi:hypothetical protein
MINLAMQDNLDSIYQEIGSRWTQMNALRSAILKRLVSELGGGSVDGQSSRRDSRLLHIKCCDAAWRPAELAELLRNVV